MDRKRRRKLGGRMSWLLRHGAGNERLRMDPAGWMAITDVLDKINMSRDELDAIIADCKKQRYQVRGDLVRATQGHSLDGMPVTQEALEASWRPYRGDDRVWHGTHLDAVEGIAVDGILPGQRTHVHLAVALDSAVGKRHRVAVMIGASVSLMREHGVEVFISPNGVVLSRSVPAACIDAVQTMTAAARGRRDEVMALLGLS